MRPGTGNLNAGAAVSTARRARFATAIWAIGALLAVTVVPALSQSQAEPQTVERSAKARAGKAARIGVYLNVKPDCTSGPLPTIRLATAPANGTVVVRKANMSGTNYKKCLSLQVPALVAIYLSRANFSGVDILDLEVRYESGRVQIHRFKIEVAAPPATQPI